MHPENRLAHNWLIKKLVNDRVRAHLSDLRGLVLDLGCGTRPYELDILAHAERYVGVDWNNTLHGLHADVAADLSRPLPLRDGIADCVVAFEVLEHVAEPERLLRESLRILTPGGLLMLSVPFQWWVHEEPWDFYRYTRFGLAHMLGKAGFEQACIEPTSGFWSMLVLKLNYQTARLPRGPRPLQLILRAAMIPFWWLGQSLAPLIDRHWPEDRETVGYFVTARKPLGSP
jgi:SAM-dependent methyltransferase